MTTESNLRFDHRLIKSRCSDLVVKAFNNITQWREWQLENEWTKGPSCHQETIDSISKRGIASLWFGDIDANATGVLNEHIEGPKWIFERHRMLLDIMAAMPLPTKEAKIYAAEATSAWALSMRSRYPRFIGSLYLPGRENAFFPICHQDVTNLTLPSQSFDVAITQEVLEHVPDLDAALQELARIIRPGGIMLSTFPFLWESPSTEVKATLGPQGIVYHSEPEYHSDPLSEDGALVFQLPGWDIIERATSNGFSRARLLFYSTKIGAVVGRHCAGMWCLMAER